VLSISSDSSFGPLSNHVTLQDGIRIFGVPSLTAGRQITAGPGGFISNVAVIDSNIDGPGSVTASSNLQLSGTNTFAGGLIVEASRSLTANADAALGVAGGSVRLENNAQFRFSAGFTVDATRPFELAGTIRNMRALGAFTGVVAADLTGAGRLEVGPAGPTLDSGAIRLTGSNTLTGSVAILGTTLEIPSDAQLGAPSGVLEIGRQVTFSPGKLRALGNIDVAATRTTTFSGATVDTNGFDVTFNQPISGLDLTKMGAGVLRLNTQNTTASPYSVLGGILRFGINDALGTGTNVSAFIDSGAALELNGFNQRFRNLTGLGVTRLGSGALTLAFGLYTYSGDISGAGDVSVQSTLAMSNRNGRFVTLSGTNTFEGGLRIESDGGLLIAHEASLGGPGAVTLDNGALGASDLATGDVTVTHTLSIGSGGAQLRGASHPLIVEGLVAGSGFLRIVGEVLLVNLANDFIGDLHVSERYLTAGTLAIGSDSALGNPANVLRLGGQTVDSEGFEVPIEGTLKAVADFTLPPSRAVRLTADDTSAILAGGVVNTNGHTLTIAGSITEAFAGNSFLKAGPGTLALDGANSYTGFSYVEEGTLLINGSVDSVQTRAFVGSTLGGVGDAGNVRVDAGAILAPGTSAGTFHTANLTLDAMSILSLEFTSPTVADQLDITGSVTLNGNVELALNLGYTPLGPDSFTVIDNDGSDPINTIGFFSIGPNLLSEGEAFTAAGADWTISYIGGTGNDVTLTVESVVPERPDADFDDDGDVDGSDLVKWKNGFGASGAAMHMQGDADVDLDVDGADFLTWQRQLGSVAAVAISSAVPEPATGVLLALVAPALFVAAARTYPHGA